MCSFVVGTDPFFFVNQLFIYFVMSENETNGPTKGKGKVSHLVISLLSR